MNTIIISFELQSFLAIEDVGDSLDSVEALIKKHENFEKSLAAQEEKSKVSLDTAQVCQHLSLVFVCCRYWKRQPRG